MNHRTWNCSASQQRPLRCNCRRAGKNQVSKPRLFIETGAVSHTELTDSEIWPLYLNHHSNTFQLQSTRGKFLPFQANNASPSSTSPLTPSQLQSSASSQSWVSHETLAISGPPLVRSVPFTARRGNNPPDQGSFSCPLLHLFFSALTPSLQQSIRKRPSTSQHPYRREANPPSPHARWEPKVPRSPPRIWQLLLGL